MNPKKSKEKLTLSKRHNLLKKCTIVFSIFLFAGTGAVLCHQAALKEMPPPLQKPKLVLNADTFKWYWTIQEAIDAPDTLNGHLLLAEPSTYQENVVVYKSVRIWGDLNKNQIIDGSGTGPAVTITTDGATIRFFTIRNNGSYPGVKIESNGNTIDGNNIEDCSRGVHIDSGTMGNIVSNNVVTNSKMEGIFLYDTTVNEIYGNTIIGNTDPMEGEMGLLLVDSSDNEIYSNTIKDNNNGIYLGSVCNNNKIYHNNFLNNYANARIFNSSENCTSNQWDCEIQLSGNYWDDHPCQDLNDDGICDTPYTIISFQPSVWCDWDQDRYPLKNQSTGVQKCE